MTEMQYGERWTLVKGYVDQGKEHIRIAHLDTEAVLARGVGGNIVWQPATSYVSNMIHAALGVFCDLLNAYSNRSDIEDPWDYTAMQIWRITEVKWKHLAD